MKKQKPFTDQEAALLLDYYLKFRSGSLSKTKAIVECSHKLRQLAINSGMEIDSAFRNEVGISFQIAGTDEIVIVAPKVYFYALAMPINKSSRNQIRDSLRSFLAIKSTMTEIELLDIVLQICPHLLNEVSFLTWRGLKECLRYLFRDTIDIQDYQIVAR